MLLSFAVMGRTIISIHNKNDNIDLLKCAESPILEILLPLFLCVLQLRKKTLEVSVWDYDKGSSNDFLGEVNNFY